MSRKRWVLMTLLLSLVACSRYPSEVASVADVQQALIAAGCDEVVYHALDINAWPNVNVMEAGVLTCAGNRLEVYQAKDATAADAIELWLAASTDQKKYRHGYLVIAIPVHEPSVRVVRALVRVGFTERP